MMHSPQVAEKLRVLSANERVFLAVDQVTGFNFTIAVSFRGKVTHDRWRAAFAELQKRHPLLNVGINTDDTHAPYFERRAGLPIPVLFEVRSSATDWQRVMEAEFAEPFDYATAPLLRAVVLEDEAGCDLVVTSNHVIIDGMGVVAMVRDLLRAMAGERLHRLPVPVSADERVDQIRSRMRESAPSLPEPPALTRTYTRRLATGKPAIDALRFSPELTAQLLSYARQEKTTAGAVLVAAMDSVLRKLVPELKEANLHILTPVDARPYLGNEEDFVLSIGSARALAAYPDAGIWQSARTLKSILLPFQSFEQIEATFKRTETIMAMKLPSATLVDAIIQKVGHDVALSNLKTVEFAQIPAELTVESVWGPSVLLGVEGEHFLGSATFGSALHLVYTSFSPVDGFLEAVRKTIVEAC
jgi:hypothetical protein